MEELNQQNRRLFRPLINVFKYLGLRIRLLYSTTFHNSLNTFQYVMDTLFISPVVDKLVGSLMGWKKLVGRTFISILCFWLFWAIIFCYYIGISYYLPRDPYFLTLLLIMGQPFQLNVIYYIYKASSTDPGRVPDVIDTGEDVSVSSVCKKCIHTKPIRSHHCIVCGRCILKMDHHCPWLNVCIGHYNHRYYILIIIHMLLACIFLIAFGIPAYHEEFIVGANLTLTSNPLDILRSIRSNVTHVPYPEIFCETCPYGKSSENLVIQSFARFMLIPRRLVLKITASSVILVGALLVGLLVWQMRGILRGQTLIEKHINASETKRYLENNLGEYRNPYDFDTYLNLAIFFGRVYLEPMVSKGKSRRQQNKFEVRTRNWYVIMLLPWAFKPMGNGLTWFDAINSEECRILKEWEDTFEVNTVHWILASWVKAGLKLLIFGLTIFSICFASFVYLSDDDETTVLERNISLFEDQTNASISIEL